MKHFGKKAAAVLLALALVCLTGLAGCGSAEKTESTSSDTAESFTADTAAAPLDTESVEGGDEDAENASSGAEDAGEAESAAAAQKALAAEEMLAQYDRLFVVCDREMVYVHANPNSGSDIIGVIEKGGCGNVIRMSTDGEWAYMTSGSVTGYVSAGYITLGEEAREIAAEYTSQRVIITAENANVRDLPSMEGEIVDIVSAGTLFDLVDTENDFYRIRYSDGAEAYVSSTVAETGVYLKTAEAKEMNNVTVVLNAFGSVEGAANALIGTTTGTPAYVLNLQIAKAIRQELENRGYTVYLVRDGDSCTLTGSERAEKAYSYGANCVIGIKCGSDADAGKSGINGYYGTSAVLSAAEAEAGQLFSSCVVQHVAAETGMAWTCAASDSFDEINACRATSMVLEAGYLTNSTDDVDLNDSGFRAMIAKGVADGLDQYYGF